MKTYTMQEAYDVAAAHLLKQNSRAYENQTCAYRTCGSQMCAIGVLIPDSVYNETMEDNSISALLEEYPTINRLFEFEGKDIFLSELQYIHDNVSIIDWGEKLTLLAHKYNLTPLN